MEGTSNGVIEQKQKKRRTPSASDLAKKQERLEAELKKVQQAIRDKELSRQKLETKKQKQERTRALILGGSLLCALIKLKQIPGDDMIKAAEAYYAEQINQTSKQPQKTGETQEDYEKRIKRYQEKLRKDRQILIDLLRAF